MQQAPGKCGNERETHHQAAGKAEGDDVGEGIVQRVWGERSFYANDPAGNPYCIVDEQTLFTGST